MMNLRSVVVCCHITCLENRYRFTLPSFAVFGPTAFIPATTQKFRTLIILYEVLAWLYAAAGLSFQIGVSHLGSEVASLGIEISRPLFLSLADGRRWDVLPVDRLGNIR